MRMAGCSMALWVGAFLGAQIPSGMDLQALQQAAAAAQAQRATGSPGSGDLGGLN